MTPGYFCPQGADRRILTMSIRNLTDSLVATPHRMGAGSPSFPAQLAAVLNPRALAIGGVYILLACVLVPILHLYLPAAHPLHLSDYFVTLIGKILCYAIVAVAFDLIWGYAGILSLGHGIFFALGGYAFGMYLMRSIGQDGSYHSNLHVLHQTAWRKSDGAA